MNIKPKNIEFFHQLKNSKIFILFFLLIVKNVSAQSDLQTAIKGGELLLTGLSIIKTTKTDSKSANSKTIESVCVKNKLNDKITFRISGKDDEDNDVKKELVVQKDGKECVFEIPKGIYTYEIVLANKEVYKKGEYKFNEEITITVKDE
jgi:hypothetical protein